MCNKCYNKNPILYKLNFSEFVINVSVNNEAHDLILDTKSFIVKNCDNDINNLIILDANDSIRTLYNMSPDNIDINIVNNILSSLIDDDNIIKQFNKLCYNILVEQKETIVFNDYSNKSCLLSSWLRDLMYTICPSEDMLIFDITKKSTYRKTFKKNKPRVVFITKCYNGNYIEKDIEFLINLGVKNIVINYRINNNQYNYKKYIEYIVDNKDTIVSLCKIQHQHQNFHYPTSDSIESETNMGNYDDIFYLTTMLFNNFLKWCCTKK